MASTVVPWNHLRRCKVVDGKGCFSEFVLSGVKWGALYLLKRDILVGMQRILVAVSASTA